MVAYLEWCIPTSRSRPKEWNFGRELYGRVYLSTFNNAYAFLMTIAHLGKYILVAHDNVTILM